MDHNYEEAQISQPPCHLEMICKVTKTTHRINFYHWIFSLRSHML